MPCIFMLAKGIRPLIIKQATLVKAAYFALPFWQLSVLLVGVRNYAVNKELMNIWVLTHAKS